MLTGEELRGLIGGSVFEILLAAVRAFPIEPEGRLAQLPAWNREFRTMVFLPSLNLQSPSARPCCPAPLTQ
jgi:hypothetical protein